MLIFFRDINPKKSIKQFWAFCSLVAFILFLILTLILEIAYAEQAKVIQVKDGDTIVVSPVGGGHFYTCRLYGIDAPETSKKGKEGQPYGEDASKYLKNLVLAKIVNVETTGDKTYNREVCRIFKDGKDINLEMVRAGYAWAYKQYLKRPHASEYLDAENEARTLKKGLWQQANPAPPWEWRRLYK